MLAETIGSNNGPPGAGFADAVPNTTVGGSTVSHGNFGAALPNGDGFTPFLNGYADNSGYGFVGGIGFGF